jgi:hypothetical protein
MGTVTQITLPVVKKNSPHAGCFFDLNPVLARVENIHTTGSVGLAQLTQDRRVFQCGSVLGNSFTLGQ